MAVEQTPEAPLKTYRGSCHCGAYIFDVELPEPVKGACECNCSVCYKKGGIWAAPVRPLFVKGDPGTLTSYTFNRKLFNHKFCPTCGVCLMIVDHEQPPKEGEEKEPQTALNLRSIQSGQGLDLWKLELTPIDGASIPPLHQPPEYTGPEPKAEVEGGKVYTGSCHCGAVRVAFKSKPLDKTHSGVIYDCNCSICMRLGSTWIYPHKDQVEIQGRENLVMYTFASHTMNKTFCNICGTPMGNEPGLLSDENLARLPEGFRKFILDNADIRSINLRIIDGVNVKELDIGRLEGYDRPPLFVEPQP